MKPSVRIIGEVLYKIRNQGRLVWDCDLKDGHKEPDMGVWEESIQTEKTMMLEGSWQNQRTEISPG